MWTLKTVQPDDWRSARISSAQPRWCQSGAFEILLVALDGCCAFVVRAGEEVARVARGQRSLEGAVRPHVRASDPDGPEAPSYALLDLELHPEGAARSRRDGTVHADCPATVAAGVV